jgi:hypothetical protein
VARVLFINEFLALLVLFVARFRPMGHHRCRHQRARCAYTSSTNCIATAPIRASSWHHTGGSSAHLELSGETL